MYGNIFTISPFRSLEGFKHVATTFELSTSENFEPESIIHTAKVGEADGDLLRYNFSKYLVPMKVYYARALRHIDAGDGIGNLDHYTVVKKIMDDKRREEALIYGVENRITTPWLTVNEEELINNNIPYFTVNTSKFKSRAGGHVATSWWVLDGAGTLLWKSLENTKDKTSIKIPKIPELINKNKLIIKAVHVGTVGVCSEPGLYFKDKTAFNFECVSQLHDIKPGVDYKLSLRRITGDAMNIQLVQLIENGIVVYELVNDLEDETLIFTIPGFLVKPKSTLEIVVTAKDIIGNMGRKSIYIKTGSNEIREVEDPGYKYEKRIEKVSEETDKLYSSGVITMETPLSYIPLPHNDDKKLYKYVLNGSSGLITKNIPLDGVVLLSNNNDDTYIQYTQNNLLLVDCWSETNDGGKRPVLTVYKHNSASDTYSLLNHIPHPENDTNTISKNTSLVQLSQYEFLYIPNGLGKIFKINVMLGTMEDIATIPIPDMIGSKNDIVIRLLKGRILVYGGINGFTYLYDPDKNEFTRSIAIEPRSFANATTRTRRLVNGDTIIFKTSKSNEDFETDVLIYNSNDNRLEPLDYSFGASRQPDGSILMLDNSLLLTKRTVGNTDTELKDIFVVYKYL